jgi:proteasome lid subunit RPN8/RPN11
MILAPHVIDAIRRHAAEAYPDECCGALIGANGSVAEAVPLPNSTDEARRRRFLVRPQDYRAAETRARTAGAALVGFYHSHPDSVARPSQYDLDHAWPNLSYAIVSVERGEPRDLRVWRLRDDRSTFDEEAVTWPSAS